MELVTTAMFYLHTTLCGVFLLFTASRLAAAGPLVGDAIGLDWRDLEGGDEWIVQASGYAVIALYLLFTEAYLYRMVAGG